MNRKHRKILAAVFTDPVFGTIEWAAIEGLLLAAGARLIEGRGSRVRFEKDGEVATFHRPHPDDDDEIFTGRITGIRDSVSFHADTVKGLQDAFHEAVDDYLETCAKLGQVMFRVDPEVHRKAALAADLAGKSLNQWAEEVLTRATE
jgi:predicted HicB family RNase H-like nuclease